MKSRVNIDRFGRIVIPKGIRKVLGIKPGSELVIELRGSMIIIRPVRDIDKVIDRWFDKMLKMNVKAKYFRPSGGKWMSDGYVRRKLGID